MSSVPAMEGRGFYNENSKPQAAGFAAVLPLWKDVAASIEVGDEPLVIADYASSQGRNSMLPMSIAIDALRSKAGARREVEIIHTDLPTNDFASLFEAIETLPDSYAKRGPGIYSSAIGRSYFDPIISRGRVHLGWNSWSLHWLSRNDVLVDDHVAAIFSTDAEARAAVERQAAEDLRRFLLARSSELRVGGKILSVSTGRPQDRLGWTWLDGELWQAVCDMGRVGLISNEERRRITSPYVQRSVTDIEAPFAAAGGVFAGLVLDQAFVFAAEDPFWAEYESSSDAKQLGTAWANAAKAFSAPMVIAALDPSRDRSALCDELFDRLAARLAAHPQKCEHFGVAVVLHKVCEYL